VDNKFISDYNDQYAIKVTYLDAGQTSWRVEYFNYRGEFVFTPSVNTNNTQTWKTASFRISGASFSGRLLKKMDFRISNRGKRDVGT